MTDLPPQAAKEIATVLHWLAAQDRSKPPFGGYWSDAPEIHALFLKWHSIIRGDLDLTDNLGTTKVAPGLSGHGRAFLERYDTAPEAKAGALPEFCTTAEIAKFFDESSDAIGAKLQRAYKSGKIEPIENKDAGGKSKKAWRTVDALRLLQK